jgi:AcrR family transcriptional regulator
MARRTEAARNGSTPKLSEETIVATARALISDVGVEGCTMRELSKRLGVSLGATYHHVANKDQLLELVGRDVYRDVADALPVEGDWRSRLRAAMIQTVELFGRYPGLASHVVSHGTEIQPEHPNLAIYELLQDAGFSSIEASELMGALFLYVAGMCMSEQVFADGNGLGSSNLLGSAVLQGSLRPVFEAGLDMLLDGADHRRSVEHPRPTTTRRRLRV